MNINEIIGGGSDYLKASDIMGKGNVTVQIANVATKDFDDGSKLILGFKNKDKCLVLNKTNTRCIGEMLGQETDDWIGSNIDIHATKVPYDGKMVDAIRVVYADSTAGIKGGADDDIPF